MILDWRQDEASGCYNGPKVAHDFIGACFQICSIGYPCFWIFARVMKVFIFGLPSRIPEYGLIEPLLIRYLLRSSC